MLPGKMTETMRSRGYIPASEAAGRIGVTVYSLYRWIEAGKVEGERVGSHWYVKADSIAACLGPHAAELLGLPSGSAAKP